MSKNVEIDSCGDCPCRCYICNGLHCGKTDKPTEDSDTIPTWCPLPDKAGWLPIESAPKDGTVLCFFNDEGGKRVFPVKIRNGKILSKVGRFKQWNAPTHYMPLPSPPEVEK